MRAVQTVTMIGVGRAPDSPSRPIEMYAASTTASPMAVRPELEVGANASG
ncbi:hypothetical protein NE235_24590 [Actinoallomurus spadix]|nr:hypothetical protein [Actinoallomurus spadix]MCO5989287.1 hypothetical protein [Actinoallomurus spadix]